MNIREMEENGTIDYYLDLKKYINEFVNKNYPLSQEDLRSILADNPTDNVLKRQETHDILNNAMQEVLKNVANRNTEIINGANEGNYTEFSVQDFEQELFQMKQEMLEKLWEKQHEEEQMQYEEEQSAEQDRAFEEEKDVITQEQEETTGEQMVEEVVAQSEEIDIRTDEINELNREINQIERDYIQEQQQPQQDMGMSIGE